MRSGFRKPAFDTYSLRIADQNDIKEKEEAENGSSHRCVSCGSENVTITLRRLRTGAKMVVVETKAENNLWRKSFSMILAARIILRRFC